MNKTTPTFNFHEMINETKRCLRNAVWKNRYDGKLVTKYKGIHCVVDDLKNTCEVPLDCPSCKKIMLSREDYDTYEEYSVCYRCKMNGGASFGDTY